MTQTPPAVPAVPVGVPAWLIRLVAAAVAAAGPLIAFIDPQATKFTPAIKAIIILGFLVVAAVIFLIHTVLAAKHEYGWTMNAVTHVEDQTLAEAKTLWPEIKQTFDAAAPALDKINGVQPTVDTLRADVNSLQERAASAGLTPEELISMFETATGVTFPRAATVEPTPPVEPDPATTGQAA